MDVAILAQLFALTGALIGLLVDRAIKRAKTNTAIVSEIHRLLGVIHNHRVWWAQQVQANTAGSQSLVPFSYDVYKAHVVDVGVLRGDLVTDVVKFYGYLAFINGLQGTRPALAAGTEIGAAFNQTYVEALDTVLDLFGPVFEPHFEAAQLIPLLE